MTAQKGKLPAERLEQSLRRIEEYKTIAQPPLPFDKARLRELSDEIARLNQKLNYTYGGTL
jgi:hypothetical protein